jgi:hypothetical protein
MRPKPKGSRAGIRKSGNLARSHPGNRREARWSDYRQRRRRVAAGRCAFEGFWDLTVLDLSEKALAAAKSRLGPKAARFDPLRTYDLWHDRAAFHFLTEAADRQAYAACVLRAVRPSGHVLIGTFAPDGPERCSGLPVMQHDGASIGAVLGNNFVRS